MKKYLLLLLLPLLALSVSGCLEADDDDKDLIGNVDEVYFQFSDWLVISTDSPDYGATYRFSNFTDGELGQLSVSRLQDGGLRLSQFYKFEIIKSGNDVYIELSDLKNLHADESEDGAEPLPDMCGRYKVLKLSRGEMNWQSVGTKKITRFVERNDLN